MNDSVYIPSEDEEGVIVKLMAHGALIRYFKFGHEFVELFDSDDYDILGDDDIDSDEGG